MRILGKLAVAGTPLLATIAFAWLLMEGLLSFGGGEKDIFLALPLLVWSVAFACFYLALSRRTEVTAMRPMALAAAAATVLVGALWAVLFAVSLFGSR